MRVALAQICTGADLNRNLSRVLEIIAEAARAGAQLVVFPEATSQAFGTGRLDEQAQPLDGEFATAVAAAASENGVSVVVGMFRPADTVQREGHTIHRVYNSALIAGPDGVTCYDKVHTYDAFNFAESDTVKPGEQLVTFLVDGIRCGVAICFDVRFPTQFQELARRGAEVIVVPTSWASGPDKLEQWRLLTRARALDSTAWIVATDQATPLEHEPRGSGPTGIGHSCVVHPLGNVLADLGPYEEIRYVDIDPAEARRARQILPVLGT